MWLSAFSSAASAFFPPLLLFLRRFCFFSAASGFFLRRFRLFPCCLRTVPGLVFSGTVFPTVPFLFRSVSIRFSSASSVFGAPFSGFAITLLRLPPPYVSQNGNRLSLDTKRQKKYNKCRKQTLLFSFRGDDARRENGALPRVCGRDRK